jgi:putative Mg2+ transporter-C (MgtC) family protein
MPLEAIPWWEMLARLILAAIIGAVIGWNPQRAHKPAGMRTHIMVSLGSALIMMISLELFLRYAGQSQNIDPGRIAAQVVTGIGFIGAGTIIHAEGGLVRGLTTAASVWAVAGIGLACGAGMYILAGLGTAVALGALALVNLLINMKKKAKKS